MKCAVCKHEITNNDPMSLIIGKNEREVKLCSNCERCINTVMESSDAGEIKKAINYMYTCSLQISDDELLEYIDEMLENNSSALKEIADDEMKTSPVNTSKLKDYFEENDEALYSSSSGWVSLLRAFVWCEIIAGIVGSIFLGYLAVSYEDNVFAGILISAVGIICTIISSAVIMIFLDIASDIRAIKNKIGNKDE